MQLYLAFISHRLATNIFVTNGRTKGHTELKPVPYKADRQA